jgi:hypothetical protein
MAPKFHDVLPWRYCWPPNRRPLGNAESSGQIGEFNVDESSSLTVNGKLIFSVDLTVNCFSFC